jgi:hypothetical protein
MSSCLLLPYRLLLLVFLPDFHSDPVAVSSVSPRFFQILLLVASLSPGSFRFCRCLQVLLPVLSDPVDGCKTFVRFFQMLRFSRYSRIWGCRWGLIIQGIHWHLWVLVKCSSTTHDDFYSVASDGCLSAALLHTCGRCQVFFLLLLSLYPWKWAKAQCWKLGSNGQTKQNHSMVSSSEEGFQVTIKGKVWQQRFRYSESQ